MKASSLSLSRVAHVALGGLVTFVALGIFAAPAHAQCPAGGYPPPPPPPPNPTAGGAAAKVSAPSTPAPASPSTPGPAGPSTAGPAGPKTPGARGPRTGGGSGPRTGRGPAPAARIPITFTRGQTSRNFLEIDWNYPIAKEVEVKDGDSTSAKRAFRALPQAEAIAALRGEDRRPLLVVRECKFCVGTDAALLSSKGKLGNNDRSILLSHFFRCVKLPPSVLHATHPHRKVFEGNEKSHVLLIGTDNTITPLAAVHTPSAMWRAMTTALRSDYQGDASKNVKELLKLLDQFDVVDAKELRLFEQMEKELETKGPRSARLAQLRKQRTEVETKKKALLEKQKSLRTLPLKTAETSAPAK